MLNSEEKFIDFAEATFRNVVDQAEFARPRSSLLASLVYRPALFRRNEIRWIAAYAWRSRARVRGLRILKQEKEALDPVLIADAAQSIATLVREIFGNKPVDAITCIPCGHSRRADCFGKQLAQSVASAIDIPFLQIFADRPCPGSSHPRQCTTTPQLRQVADPPRSVMIIDDVATSGWHLEEAALMLRRSGVAASSIVWISGASGGLPIGSRDGESTPEQRPTSLDGSASRRPFTASELTW
jgi:predicted amidophosphoribosyltransferase